jgi:hypothetical protein
VSRGLGLAFAIVATLAAGLPLPLEGTAQQTPGPAAPVQTEFRAFNGAEEVTASTRFRLTPVGSRDGGGVIEVTRPTTALAPAVYDVQALRADRGVIAIKRVDGLAVMHYPDEGGRHLEVINFRAGYGALQLRAARGQLRPDDVTLFRTGSRQTSAGRPATGDDYLLFVVPAGQYDVRLQHPDRGGAGDAHWLVGVTVAPDRTRLKLIDAAVEP